MGITKPTTAERLRIIQAEKIRIRRCIIAEMNAIREKYNEALTVICEREFYLKTKYKQEREEMECKG